jgi:hypothetical protein
MKHSQERNGSHQDIFFAAAELLAGPLTPPNNPPIYLHPDTGATPREVASKATFHVCALYQPQGPQHNSLKKQVGEWRVMVGCGPPLTKSKASL